jgi:hypothetical protein
MEPNLNISEHLVEKWAPVLDHPSIEPIADPFRKAVTARLLENQEMASKSQGMVLEADIPNVAGNDLSGVSGSLSKYDPVMISMIRRAYPKLIAFDILGVQPMTGPTGLIFSMKSTYASSTVPNVSEALFGEANTAYSGTGTHEPFAGGNPATGANTSPLDAFTAGIGVATATGELDDAWNQMGFEIEKTTVGVKTRNLKADYSTELAQDLKAVHNMDAESELANILSQEILNEINREVVRDLYAVAKAGGTSENGVVNLSTTSGDINGRYFAEQWRGLQFMIERDAVRISKDTRMGKGNFIIVDAETAAALAANKILDYATLVDPRAALGSMPDETTGTFLGTIGGKMKVYVDPFVDIAQNFYMVGYKGASAWDAGMFYCPYVPLQMTKVMHENSFQPSIGFKTRYGIVEHPFSGSSYLANPSASTLHSNKYYRISVIQNLI